MTTQEGIENWPSQGRVGRLRDHGERTGVLVFVFPEADGRWGFYSSDGDDAVLPNDQELLRAFGEMQIEWLVGDEEEALERAVFGMRPLVSSVFNNEPNVLQRIRRAWSARKQ